MAWSPFNGNCTTFGHWEEEGRSPTMNRRWLKKDSLWGYLSDSTTAFCLLLTRRLSGFHGLWTYGFIRVIHLNSLSNLTLKARDHCRGLGHGTIAVFSYLYDVFLVMVNPSHSILDVSPSLRSIGHLIAQLVLVLKLYLFYRLAWGSPPWPGLRPRFSQLRARRYNMVWASPPPSWSRVSWLHNKHIQLSSYPQFEHYCGFFTCIQLMFHLLKFSI